MRTRNTLGKIVSGSDLSVRFREVMQSYIDQGQVTQVNEPLNLSNSGPHESYLSVFPVSNKDKTRLVFDSSAKSAGKSLNDCLYKGPDATNRLIGVLNRFRKGEVGFVADVEKMFHAFWVPTEQRDALRFFWWDNNCPGNELKIFRANVHIFGNRSSPSVATYALRHTTTSNFAETVPNSCSYINTNFYVDDGLGSEDSVESAIKTLSGARAILAEFNIRLHKIVSNDRSVLEAFPTSEVDENVRERDLASLSSHNTLGLSWNLDEDTLSLKYTLIDRPFTKRGVLSSIGLIYDPLGFIAPIVLAGRILQREILEDVKNQDENSDWDTPLPERWHQRWLSWWEDLPGGLNIRVPRCHHPRNFGQVASSELHVFCDASSNAIGLVIYLKQTNVEGEIATSFIFGSSKVAPRAATSIPRLELCAAAEAARTSTRIAKELDQTISKTVYYSDSRIVLGYLSNTKRAFPRYVTSRVALILQFTGPSEWRYIPSGENPADITSRPYCSRDLMESCWITGPECIF